VNKLPAIGEEIDVPAAPVQAPAPAALPPIGGEIDAPNIPENIPDASPDVDARLKSLFQLGLQINPTEQAGVNYLARELDLPPAIVAQQYPLFQKAAEAVGFDPARFRRENPGLVELLLENPRSGLHPKQAEQLSGFTKAVRTLWRSGQYGDEVRAPTDPFGLPIGEAVDVEGLRGKPTREELSPAPKMVPTRQSELKGRTGLETTAAIVTAEGRRGLLQNELGEVGFSLLVAHQLGENTDLLRRRQIEIEQELGVQVDYGQNALEQLAIDAEKGVMSQWQTVKEGGKGYALGLGIGTFAGLGATRNPAQALRYGHAVGLIFGKAGFSYGSFKQESGSTFVQLLDEKLDDGTPLDRDVAAGAAFLYGVAAAAVEVAAFGELAKSLGPLRDAIVKGEGRAAIRAWAADRSKREILRGIGKQWAKSAASEALEEGTQTTLQHAITWGGKSLAAGTPQTFDRGAWVKETAESMYLGGLAGGAMAAPGSVAHAGARLQALEASRGRGAVVAEIAKLAGTEAALGAPQAVAELVARESRRAGAGDIRSAYLDVEAAETFFQTQGTTAGEALSELLAQDVRAAVAAARAGENLGRIEIPLATYLEKLGPTGVAEALAGDTAVRPFDATLNEQARQQRDLWAEAEDAVQLWQKTGKTPDAEPGEVEWADEIAKRATESGAAKKADAKRFQLVARAFVRTMVKRYGEPARQLMGRYAMDVRPADTMPGLAEGQAAVPQEALVTPQPGEAPIEEETLAQASPAGVDVLRRGDVLVLEHPESPLRLSARDEGDTIVSELLGFNERVPEHVESIKAFGGQGYSTALYLRALEEAKAAGKGFASDVTRTDATERMYARLRELEVPVTFDAAEDRYTIPAAALAAVDLDRSWRLMLAESEIKAMREGVKLFARKPDQKEQGWTRFYRVARKGLRQLFQVATTEDADASTLLHEFAHVGLEIFGDLAELEGAPAEAKAEYARILAWLGVASRAEITREHHERFAGAFETYLYEGKTPSLRLASVFSRMRAWFMRVGRTLKGAGVPLNDEIRGLFDRMLAVDEEIATVREQYAAGEAAEIFPSAESAGLTPEQYDEYLAAKERAFEDARIRVQQRLLAEQQIANEGALRAAGKTAREQASTEFDELRESRVLRFLRKADVFGNPALRALVEETREQESKEATKVEVPAELAAKLKELDRQEDELRASGGTRRVLVVVGGEFQQNGTQDGRGVPTNLVPLFKVRVAAYQGQRLGHDEQLRVVTLPAWLGDEEYSSDRAAWEWTWAAGGRRVPQAEQRFLHELVTTKQLARAWAAGRLLSKHDGTEYQAKLAAQIRDWLSKAPAARVHDSPLAPRQWETIAEGRAFSRFRRWEISTGRAIKDNVAGLGDAVEPEEAGDAAVALREEGDGREALYAEIEAARAELDRQVAEARVAQQRGRVKLDLQAVVDAVGTEAAEKVFRGLTRADGGMTPDRLAELFGFATGEEMVKAIATLPDRDAWVSDRADRALAEEHPTLLSERARLAEAVADAAHAKGDIEFFLRQWEIFRSKAGDKGRAPREALERAAEGIVKGKRAGALNLKLALDAETGAARRAVEAAGRGNWRQAAVLQQQAILNHFIYRAMLEARGQRDELERMAKTMTPEKYRGQIGRVSPAIRDAIDQILEATGLRDRIPRDVAPHPISEAVRAMESFGTSVMLDQEFLEQLVARPVLHTEMLVANMRKVLEALKNLRAAALSQQEVIDGDKRLAKEDAIGALELEAAQTTPHQPEAVEEVAKNVAEKVSSFGATVHGEVLRINTMIRWLGGRDTRSAWYRLVMEPLQRAKHREVELLHGPFKAVIEAFEKMPSAVRRRLNDKVDGRALFAGHRPDLRPPTHRFQILMMALNAGNQSNLDRLLDGRGITIGQLDRALSTLTRAELEWVQEVWDACESLWPLSRDLEERDAGVAPPKIEARPLRVISSDGEEVLLRGGYFPAAYIREVSTAGEKQALQTVQDILSPGFTRPGTPHSHLKGRVENFSDAIATDPAVILRHLTQVAHDLAFREPLKSVASLIMDERIQELLKRRLGPERSPQFLQWLKDIGSMRAAENAAGAHGVVKFARRLRSNAAVGILGYAAEVALGDITNLGVAVIGTELKLHWWARGLSEFVANPVRAIRWTGKASGELVYRRHKQSDEFRRHIEGMTSKSPLKRGALERFKRFAFVFMEATDAVTSTPIWMGAYHQAVAQGRTKEEAVVFADELMGRLFSSHSKVDQSFMLRRKDALELFQLFQGYASVLANLYLDKAHQIHEARTVSSKARKTVEMVAFSLALGSVASVAADFIMGHGPTDDDEDDEVSREEWAHWFGERLLLGWAYVVPIFGWVGEAGVSLAKGKRPSVRTAPIYSGLEGIGRSVQKAIAAEEREELSEKEVIEILKSAGILAGVPAVRPARWTQLGIDLWQGEVEETGPLDLGAGFLYGDRAGLNPLQPTK
jgi:hypothetical protein